MHHMTKKAAVAKYSAMLSEGEQAVKAAIAAEYPDDVEEIYAALEAPAANAAPSAAAGLNAGLDLDRFDYNNLSGKDLIDYVNLLASLDWNKQFDYQVYKIKFTKGQRHEGVEGSPIDIVSVGIKENAPIHTTRVEAKHANDMNGIVTKQLRNGLVIESAQFTNTGRMFFLKK